MNILQSYNQPYNQFYNSSYNKFCNKKDLQPAMAFAPANIALCKYWGKRDQQLNLPVTSSLSISLGDLGATTKVSVNELTVDRVELNAKPVAADSVFYQRIVKFINLFRPQGMYFDVQTQSNIAVAAGLASSAAGFAALAMAFDKMFAWELPKEELSILARRGSGSASRSLWHGFVKWNAGTADDGTDSYAELLPYTWPELRVGILAFTKAEKSISSRQAMQVTVDSCPYYALWPEQVEQAMTEIKTGIQTKNFAKLGAAAEFNCLQMHALMQASKPAIIYSNAHTLAAIEQVWQLRRDGLEVYFTQDAGPNIKLLFLQDQQTIISSMFPQIKIIEPFAEFRVKV